MRILPITVFTLALAGCTVGPDYVRPTPPPGTDQAAFKESSLWKPAAPTVADFSSAWWQAFGDPQLDALVEEANHANQTIQQVEAQYRQAQALVQNAQAAYFPTVGIGASVNRGRNISNSGMVTFGNNHAWSVQASWELDLWGSVRRRNESAEASAQASASDLAAAQLTVQAAVVNNYLQLRIADQQKELYARTIAGYDKSLALTEAQFRAGVVTASDVALARNTLATTRAQAVDVDLTRRQLEHAIAVLTGRTPSAFSLPLAPFIAKLPTAPLGIPSELLERRPDISGAERRVAAANANIGVAIAAWYPHLTLSASGGYQNPGLGPWFSAPEQVWALGASLAATLFDGGLRSAQIAQSQAIFDAAAANYRQTVLSSFQEVEDNLAALGDLETERTQQEIAASSAHQSEQVLLAQYKAGTTNYTSVITSQALALTAERTVLQVQGRQFAASVALIKALGGGWNSSQLSLQPPPPPDATAANDLQNSPQPDNK